MIKNYTSEVPANRSIMKIEELLVQMGAKNINKEYADGELKAIIFLMEDSNGLTKAFKLPAKVDVISDILTSQIKRPRKDSYSKARKQAERTAWKILFDWVEVQHAMVVMRQAEPQQVFLPYMYSFESGSTLWEQVISGKIQLKLGQ